MPKTANYSHRTSDGKRYTLSVSVGTPPTRQTRERTFPLTSTLTERKRWYQRARLQLQEQVDADQRVRTTKLSPDAAFVDAADAYLQARHHKISFRIDKLYCSRWVNEFRQQRISTITTEQILTIRSGWITQPRPKHPLYKNTTRDPWSPQTINKHLKLLKQIFRQACGKYGYNPVVDIDELAYRSESKRPISQDLLLELLSVMQPCGSAVRLKAMFYLGFGHANMFLLKPEDVDWTNNRIYQQPRLKGKGAQKEGYWKPVTEEGMAALRDMRDGTLDGTPLLAGRSLWGRYAPVGLLTVLNGAKDKLTARYEDRLKSRDLSQDEKEAILSVLNLLPHVSPYSMRHSFATDCFRATGDLKTTQLMVGHESSATTLRYAKKAVPVVLARAAKAMNDAYRETAAAEQERATSKKHRAQALLTKKLSNEKLDQVLEILQTP